MFLRLLISVKFTNHAKNLDETVKEGAEINTFLQIDDEEDNIQPSFYSFGTGERDVQVRYMFILEGNWRNDDNTCCKIKNFV